ncbi:MAG TPA: NAD(P)-dependent alcohol dehydrogenase [Candidatus Limnocylindria bacterium]|nr:NAD(P)-dependent alcohol dehydrogenase [Candidatus Limnocylindria bacterium]
MKAFVRDRYGAPEVLRLADVPGPPVNPEQALVRVHAWSINAHDWHMLQGKPYLARLSEGLRRPKTPGVGLDFAGTVEAVGDVVDHVRVGDRVFGSRYGAFAELVAGKNVVPIPDGVSFESAAAVPTAGMTALQAVRDHGDLRDGERVLVLGAGGGVGTFAVQIGCALGGAVTAVTRADSVERLRSVGATRVIDHATEDVTRGADRYDLVVDVAGTHSLRALRRILTPGGRVVIVAPAPGNWIAPVARMLAPAFSRRFGDGRVRGFIAEVRRHDLVELGRMLADGSLRPTIDRTYPFDQLPEAIRHVEAGRARGKVIVTR